MDKVLDQVVGDVDGEVLHPPSQVHQLLADEHHVLVLHVEVVRLFTDGALDQVLRNFLCPIEYHIEGQGVHRCIPDKIKQTRYWVICITCCSIFHLYMGLVLGTYPIFVKKHL